MSELSFNGSDFAPIKHILTFHRSIPPCKNRIRNHTSGIQAWLPPPPLNTDLRFHLRSAFLLRLALPRINQVIRSHQTAILVRLRKLFPSPTKAIANAGVSLNFIDSTTLLKRACEMNRSMALIVIAALALTSAGQAQAWPQEMNSQVERRPNVLFVSVDDLRPEVGCYGNPVIKTPNFDAFAKTGTTFLRAYCQSAACAPVSGECDDWSATGLDARLGSEWQVS